MNNGILETSSTERLPKTGRASRSPISTDELSRLKRELLQAEVRLAKARATAVAAEVDIKVLNAHLKSLVN